MGSHGRFESTDEDALFRGLLTCQPCVIWIGKERESKAWRPRRLLLWSQIWAVPDLGWWQMGEIIKERIYVICQLDILKKVRREKSKMTLKL